MVNDLSSISITHFFYRSLYYRFYLELLQLYSHDISCTLTISAVLSRYQCRYVSDGVALRKTNKQFFYSDGATFIFLSVNAPSCVLWKWAQVKPWRDFALSCIMLLLIGSLLTAIFFPLWVYLKALHSFRLSALLFLCRTYSSLSSWVVYNVWFYVRIGLRHWISCLYWDN